MHVLEPEPTTQHLLSAISLKRHEMMELGMTYGLTDERTVRCSQQLDYLLNIRHEKEFYLAN